MHFVTDVTEGEMVRRVWRKEFGNRFDLQINKFVYLTCTYILSLSSAFFLHYTAYRAYTTSLKNFTHSPQFIYF